MYRLPTGQGHDLCLGQGPIIELEVVEQADKKACQSGFGADGESGQFSTLHELGEAIGTVPE